LKKPRPITSEAPTQTDEKSSPTEPPVGGPPFGGMESHRIFLIPFLWDRSSMGENVDKFCK